MPRHRPRASINRIQYKDNTKETDSLTSIGDKRIENNEGISNSSIDVDLGCPEKLMQPIISKNELPTNPEISQLYCCWRCCICKEEFDSDVSVKHHSMGCGKKFICSICDTLFSYGKALLMHKHSGTVTSKEHDKGNRTKNKNCGKMYLCVICGNTFQTKSGLKGHMNAHSDSRPYKCDQCEKAFNHYPNLVTHRKRHSAERPYTCEICSRSFKYASVLAGHRLTHSTNKPFSCADCGASFARKGALSVHERTHKPEKPFKCQHCEKSFSQKATLNNHVRIHTNEKPFSCPVCNQAFAQKTNMNTHMKLKHTNEKNYRCGICDQRFVTKSHAQRHSLTHSGIKPFVCGLCGQQFSRKESVVNHLKKCCRKNASTLTHKFEEGTYTINVQESVCDTQYQIISFDVDDISIQDVPGVAFGKSPDETGDLDSSVIEESSNLPLPDN